MNRFIRFFNQNRKVIFWSIIVIAFILILIQLLNSLAESSHKYKANAKIENSLSNNNELQENNTYNSKNVLLSSDSLTQDEQISSRALTDDSNLIQSFVKFCNNQEVEQAYNLLSDDCKEQLYPNIDDFERNYYNLVFNGSKKNVTVENWNKQIYRIKLNEDNILQTGNLQGGSSQTDYFTIVLDSEGNEKLNINGFVGKKEINK